MENVDHKIRLARKMMFLYWTLINFFITMVPFHAQADKPHRDLETSHPTGSQTKKQLDYNSRDSIPLHIYVIKEVEPAALELEASHYKKALKLVKDHRFHTPGAVNESHYIEALCLQALGRFHQSAAEFDRLANRRAFPDKIAIGRACATEHTRTIRLEQIRFPSTTIAPDIFEIMAK